MNVPHNAPIAALTAGASAYAPDPSASAATLGIGQPIADEAGEQRRRHTTGARAGDEDLGRVTETFDRVVQRELAVDESVVLHDQAIAVVLGVVAEVHIAGAVGHEHEGPVGKRVGGIVEVEDAAGAGRVVFGAAGDLVAAGVEGAALGVEAGPAALEIEHDLGGVGFADPEAPVAAVGAHAVVTAGDLFPDRLGGACAVRGIVVIGGRGFDGGVVRRFFFRGRFGCLVGLLDDLAPARFGGVSGIAAGDRVVVATAGGCDEGEEHHQRSCCAACTGRGHTRMHGPEC